MEFETFNKSPINGYQTNENNNSVIEGFFDTTSDSCNKDSIDPITGKKTTSDWFSKVRSTNLQAADKEYNEQLAQYLNAYHNYLVILNLKENATTQVNGNAKGESAISTNYTAELSKAQKAYETAQEGLEAIAAGIISNNKTTQQRIDNQTDTIKDKRIQIRNSQALISKQSDILSDKNKIMNSRERQIELGVSKNLYKRNVMYFLVVVNIIIVFVLFGLIFKGN
jgi:hypothetical protein